jgi:hypothetical protein
MRGRLCNLLAVLSLLLCMATIVTWPFSYRSVFRRDYQIRPGRSLILQTYRGDVFVTLYQELVSWPVTASRPYWEWKFLGFSIGCGDRQGVIKHFPPGGTNNYERIRQAAIPFWAVSVLSASFAVQVFWRRRPRTAGHCIYCGYDLRATPDRCPECGTAVGAKEGTARERAG